MLQTKETRDYFSTLLEVKRNELSETCYLESLFVTGEFCGYAHICVGMDGKFMAVTDRGYFIYALNAADYAWRRNAQNRR